VERAIEEAGEAEEADMGVNDDEEDEEALKSEEVVRDRSKVKQRDPIAKFLQKIPPDWHKADLHGKAMSVYDVSKLRMDTNPSDDQFCKWIGMKVPEAGSEFALNCDNKELAGLGPGFPLYFEFKK